LPFIPPSSNAPQEYTFSPNAIFNRIRIGIKARNNGNHSGELNLHHVQLTPPAPTSDADGGNSAFEVCEGNITLSVNNPSSSYEYKWYQNNVLLSGGSSGQLALNLLSGTFTYQVTALRTGCPTTAESPRHTITVTSKPKPFTPIIALTN
jgi:hypothetical protein